MARPKYNNDQIQARNRIIDTFWEYLQETSFEKMNVKEIVIRSRVNKNTFYYHFECMDDLANTAIDGVLLSDHATALNGAVIKKLIEIWSAYIKVNDSKDDIYLLMTFVAGGIVTTLRGKQPEEFFGSLKRLFNMSGIRTCIHDMQQISLIHI